MPAYRSSFADSIHVVHGGPRLPGARHYVVLRDSFELGPASLDAIEHGLRRRAFWTWFDERIDSFLPPDQKRDRQRSLEKQRIETDIIISAADFAARMRELPDLPVVIWTTAEWSNRLTLWWTCAALTESVIDPGRLWIAEPRTPAGDDPKEAMQLLAHTEEQFAIALSNAVPLSSKFLAEGAQLWRAFAGNDAMRFDKLRKTESASFPRLEAETQPYRCGLPRVDAAGRLGLCDLDDLLFNAMQEQQWIRPADIITATPYDHPVFRSYRDLFITLRLDQWESQPGEPAVLSEPRKGRNVLTRVAYRLTAHGRKLLSAGLSDVAEAPPIDVGGIRAYVDPCAVRGSSESWEVVRL